MGVSVNPKNAVDGGLFEAGTYRVDKAEYVVYDYNGKTEAVPALRLVATGIEGDVEGKEVDQYYKAGDVKDFSPSPDGKELIAVGKKTALNKKCNTVTFMTELLNAGAPEAFVDSLGDDISMLVGMVADFGPMSMEYEIRKEKKTSTIFVPVKIIEIPGEAGAGDAGDDEVAAAAIAAMQTILAANKGKIKKNDIPGKVMALQIDEDIKPAVVQMLFKDEFLTAEFTLKNGVVSK